MAASSALEPAAGGLSISSSEAIEFIRMRKSYLACELVVLYYNVLNGAAVNKDDTIILLKYPWKKLSKYNPIKWPSSTKNHGILRKIKLIMPPLMKVGSSENYQFVYLSVSGDVLATSPVFKISNTVELDHLNIPQITTEIDHTLNMSFKLDRSMFKESTPFGLPQLWTTIGCKKPFYSDNDPVSKSKGKVYIMPISTVTPPNPGTVNLSSSSPQTANNPTTFLTETNVTSSMLPTSSVTASMQNLYETISSVNSLIQQYERMHRETLAQCDRLQQEVKARETALEQQETMEASFQNLEESDGSIIPESFKLRADYNTLKLFTDDVKHALVFEKMANGVGSTAQQHAGQTALDLRTWCVDGNRKNRILTIEKENLDRVTRLKTECSILRAKSIGEVRDHRNKMGGFRKEISTLRCQQSAELQAKDVAIQALQSQRIAIKPTVSKQKQLKELCEELKLREELLETLTFQEEAILGHHSASVNRTLLQRVLLLEDVISKKNKEIKMLQDSLSELNLREQITVIQHNNSLELLRKARKKNHKLNKTLQTMKTSNVVSQVVGHDTAEATAKSEARSRFASNKALDCSVQKSKSSTLPSCPSSKSYHAAMDCFLETPGLSGTMRSPSPNGSQWVTPEQQAWIALLKMLLIPAPPPITAEWSHPKPSDITKASTPDVMKLESSAQTGINSLGISTLPEAAPQHCLSCAVQGEHKISNKPHNAMDSASFTDAMKRLFASREVTNQKSEPVNTMSSESFTEAMKRIFSTSEQSLSSISASSVASSNSDVDESVKQLFGSNTTLNTMNDKIPSSACHFTPLQSPAASKNAVSPTESCDNLQDAMRRLFSMSTEDLQKTLPGAGKESISSLREAMRNLFGSVSSEILAMKKQEVKVSPSSSRDCTLQGVFDSTSLTNCCSMTKSNKSISERSVSSSESMLLWNILDSEPEDLTTKPIDIKAENKSRAQRHHKKEKRGKAIVCERPLSVRECTTRSQQQNPAISSMIKDSTLDSNAHVTFPVPGSCISSCPGTELHTSTTSVIPCLQVWSTPKFSHATVTCAGSTSSPPMATNVAPTTTVACSPLTVNAGHGLQSVPGWTAKRPTRGTARVHHIRHTHRCQLGGYQRVRRLMNNLLRTRCNLNQPRTRAHQLREYLLNDK